MVECDTVTLTRVKKNKPTSQAPEDEENFLEGRALPDSLPCHCN